MRTFAALMAPLMFWAALLLLLAPPVVDESALPLQPVRLVIPAIDVDTGMERLMKDGDGRLPSPVEAQRAGWFVESPVPGELGSSVVVGHRDSVFGPAVFWRLADLRPGNRMFVARSDGGTEKFEVVEVRRVPRTAFPTDDVYGAIPDRALRLITCGGRYDARTGGYRENVLVLALAI